MHEAFSSISRTKKKAAEKFERMVECRKDGEQVLPVATVC
jgi:hypothetical protein